MADPHSMDDAADGNTPTTSEDLAYQRTLLGQIDKRKLSAKPARIALGFLLGAVLIIPSIQFLVRIQKTETSLWRSAGMRHRTALGRWLPTAELITKPESKEDPYGFGHWFPTPPMILLLLVPLSKLGYLGAGVVWVVLKVLGFLWAMSLIIRGLGRESYSLPLGVIVAAGIYSIRPIISDLQHGNLNIYMMIWLALAWSLYVRRKDFSAGLLIALAIVTKLTPALVLVYFIYKREWRVCIGAGVGLVLVFLVIPGLLLGFDRNLQYLQDWFNMLVAPYALHGYATLEVDNQSLYGLSLRLLSNSGLLHIAQMPTEDAFRAGVDNMARPATIFGRLLRPAISLPILAALAWWCRSRCDSRRDVRRILEYGLVLIAMLLLSERTWDHHASTLPIVFLGIWYGLTCFDYSDRFRAWYVAGLAVQFVLLVGSTAGLFPERITDRLLEGGVFCWGLVLCFIQIGILLTAENRRRSHAYQP